ncbi:hypothetical protein ACFUXL_34440, partial [Streptomyces cinereoruber]
FNSRPLFSRVHDGNVRECRPTALAALDRRKPPPGVIARRMHRVMAFLARRLATQHQVGRAIGRCFRPGSPRSNNRWSTWNSRSRTAMTISPLPGLPTAS